MEIYIFALSRIPQTKKKKSAEKEEKKEGNLQFEDYTLSCIPKNSRKSKKREKGENLTISALNQDLQNEKEKNIREKRRKIKVKILQFWCYFGSCKLFYNSAFLRLQFYLYLGFCKLKKRGREGGKHFIILAVFWSCEIKENKRQKYNYLCIISCLAVSEKMTNFLQFWHFTISLQTAQQNAGIWVGFFLATLILTLFISNSA